MASTSGIRNLQALKLYKALIREAKQFTAYNFRSYALRRIRDAFRENRNLTDLAAVNDQIAEGTKSLETIKRQVLIGKLYSADKLVIENVQPN